MTRMRKKGSVFIALGLLLLAAALALTLFNIWDAHRADVAAQEAVQELRTLIPLQTGEPAPEACQPDIAQPVPETLPSPEEETEETEKSQEQEEIQAIFPQEREMPTVELNGYRYIGVLEVEALELSLPVMEQWDYDRLKISPCRFAGNVYQDDLVICGHNYANHFASLKYAPIGTEVRFTDAEGTVFRYAVASFDTLGHNDVEKLLGGDWDLTLFTCNTSGQTRCVVRCDRIQ